MGRDGKGWGGMGWDGMVCRIRGSEQAKTDEGLDLGNPGSMRLDEVLVQVQVLVLVLVQAQVQLLD